MALFTWSDKYSVGNSAMNDHHKNLFNILNKLYDLDESDIKFNIGHILNDLISYTEYHFREEEILMEKAQYVGLASQKNAHCEFVNRLKEYRDKVKNNADMSIFVANEVAMTATEWLKVHILKMDKDYEKSLRDAGLM
jgi:hemerythrin-like metal-binding protein